MAKMNDTGVYQLPNKNWAFRYTLTEYGRKKDVRKAKDEFGNPNYNSNANRNSSNNFSNRGLRQNQIR